MSEDSSAATAGGSPAIPYGKPLPEPTPVTQPFWDAAREGRLLLQRSKKTGKAIFYPRSVSPFGPDDELEWFEASGRGAIYTYTVGRRPVAPQWANDPPLIIAIVELEEGPHMTTNIVDCDPDAVKVGMPVTAVFDAVTPEVTLVKFRPVSG
ncbi:MAG: Zn-ribbon domain-containing OB-fold protein [Thermoflexaceae bacterium]|nr:Zn-ribbon domain-containing OB-fold protein [Thermoflexaceae bacterium]